MLLFSLLFQPTFANVQRIESRIQHLNSTSAIYIKFGLISVVEFPQSIIEARIGNPNVLKAVISQASPRELTLYYKVSSLSPTNLIVKSDKKIYVLDIIPSKTNHQDFVKITSGVGTYNSSNNLMLLSEVQIKPSVKPKENKKLLEKVEL